MIADGAGLAALEPGQSIVGKPRITGLEIETPVTFSEYRFLPKIFGDPSAGGPGNDRIEMGFFELMEERCRQRGEMVLGEGELRLVEDALMLRVTEDGGRPVERVVTGVPVVATRSPIQRAEGWEAAPSPPLYKVLPVAVFRLVRDAQLAGHEVIATPITFDDQYLGYSLSVAGWRVDVTAQSAFTFPFELAPHLDHAKLAAHIRRRLSADEPPDVIESFESRYLAGAWAAHHHGRFRRAERAHLAVLRTCAVCNRDSKQARGRPAPDSLDTRGVDGKPSSPLAAAGLIEECPHCGQLAPDISQFYRCRDADAVRTLLALPGHVDLARRCLVVARLFGRGGLRNEEARWVLRAAWADEAAGVAADITSALRARAVSLLDERSSSSLVLAELCRTSGDFGRALGHAQRSVLQNADEPTVAIALGVALQILVQDEKPLLRGIALENGRGMTSTARDGLVGLVLASFEPETALMLCGRLSDERPSIVCETCDVLAGALARNPYLAALVPGVSELRQRWAGDMIASQALARLGSAAAEAYRGRFHAVGADEPGLATLLPKVMQPAPAGAIERCESLARELCRRCSLWGLESIPQHISWQRAPEPSATGDATDGCRIRAMLDRALGLRAARLTLGELEHDPHMKSGPADWREPWQKRARYDLVRGNAWRRAVTEERNVSLRMPVEARGRSFASLDDPFEPLMEIWELGCALVAVTGDAIVVAGVAGGEGEDPWSAANEVRWLLGLVHVGRPTAGDVRAWLTVRVHGMHVVGQGRRAKPSWARSCTGDEHLFLEPQQERPIAGISVYEDSRGWGTYVEIFVKQGVPLGDIAAVTGPFSRLPAMPFAPLKEAAYPKVAEGRSVRVFIEYDTPYTLVIVHFER